MLCYVGVGVGGDVGLGRSGCGVSGGEGMGVYLRLYALLGK